jgi:hypothetical protein
MRIGRRALLLAALFAAGSITGLAGYAATGSAWWFLAVPLAVAAGWLFVADPARCERPDGAPPSHRREGGPR